MSKPKSKPKPRVFVDPRISATTLMNRLIILDSQRIYGAVRYIEDTALFPSPYWDLKKYIKCLGTGQDN